MKCLNCGNEMTDNLVLTRESQIAYDICDACGSLWLDQGELDKMAFQVKGSIEYSSREPAEAGDEPRKECPRCEGAALDKVAFVGYSDIVLDRCGECGGFWLDGGELDLVNRELQEIMPVTGKGFSEFVNRAHLPYWYKRLERRNVTTEFAVPGPPVKGAELKEEAGSECPACEAPLNRYIAFGIELEGCPDCKGLWLDKGELRRLKDKAQEGPWTDLRWVDDEIEAIGRTNATPANRSCPKCEGQRLVAAAVGGSEIMVDWCPSCRGIWLDQDEFREICDCLKSKFDELSSDEMKRKVYEEIREIWNGPEGAISEILDAKAAIAALISITIFEHPKLCDLLTRFSQAARSIGL
ncbi:MAG: TFIIB-type zinc ribbon-containing protein [Planctomycetota bacterium]